MRKCSSAPDAEIEAGLDYLAYLIKLYGDQFWPVFDRLDRELEARRSRVASLKARRNRSRLRSDGASLRSVS